MKVFRTIAGCMVLLALTSCGSSKSDNQQDSDSIDSQNVEADYDQDTTEEEEEEDQSTERVATHAENVANFDVITAVYEKFVFGGSDSNPRPYFTSKALKKLAQSYNDNGNAYSEFTTKDQTGTSKTQRIESISAEKEYGWYLVLYTDKGKHGQTKIKMVNGKIADFRRIR